MGTDKRDRQRANRAVKEAAASVQARRKKTLKRIRTLLVYAVIFALVIFLATQVFGQSDDHALSIPIGL